MLWQPHLEFNDFMKLLCEQNEFGVWEIFLPNNADDSLPIPHGSRVKVTLLT